ncbi:MAG TPA: riboflavin synthase [Candidatus Acidoferrum sp.]|nr:riboflavin synthase [Candidatus Acidoferrum sp.]
MFTGIIEHEGTVQSLELKPDGGRLTIHAPNVAPLLAVSKSIAVNGCCLTVVALDKKQFSADLSAETIQKTSFGAKPGGLNKGSRVNLEQPLTAADELGGHFVLGHVDMVGHVAHLTPEGENWWLGVEVPEDFARYIVPKGSITIDGISLTVARWNNQTRNAEVAVIPYTYEHTNIRDRKPGDAVNLEGDVLGKYVERFLGARQGMGIAPKTELNLEELIKQGF